MPIHPHVARPHLGRAVAAVVLALATWTPPAATGAPDSTGAPHEAIVFSAELGSFSTTLMGSRPERTANIRLAAEALDGAILTPGEVLSFNARVGPRTVARGYQMAPVILRDARQLQAGGGICQVSSTLLMAALTAGLGIVERHRHSFPVDYVPLGHDATIAWGAKDLRLRNDLDQPVRLRIELLGGTLAARIEGEVPLGERYELATEEREIPGDPSVGSAPGREIDVYRVRRVDGEEADRTFLYRDRYPPTRAHASLPTLPSLR